MKQDIHIRVHTPEVNQGIGFIPHPPLPPHRKSYHESEPTTFLQPENRPLLPPPYPNHSPYTIFPDDVQKSLYWSPNIQRHLMEFPNSTDDVNHPGMCALPTPKPRNRFPDHEENMKEEMAEEDRSGWLCRDDMSGGFRPTLLTNPYLQRRSPSRYQTSRYASRLTSAAKLRCTSSDHLDGSMCGSPQYQQQCRSMTTLNLTPSESQQANFYDTEVRRAPDPWLGVADGQARLKPGEMGVSGEAEVIRRPTAPAMVEQRSSLIWQPMKSDQNL